MQPQIGTSGWNYPTGRGTWNGVFYPSRRSRGFDELAYYAEHFDTVEVNSTFYRMPEPLLVESWLRRTPASFLLAVKLFQKFTHPDMYLAREGVTDWDVSRTDVELFRRGIEPAAQANRLGALLLQFPSSFHHTPETLAYLEWLLMRFAGYPLAVELRHRTWTGAEPQIVAVLAEHGATWVQDDSPVSERMSLARAGAAGLVYVRLHGRNGARWWDHDEAEDRYDYLYSSEELEPIAETARTAGKAGRRVLVYFNNHFSAKAVANAAVLKHRLGDLVPGDYPPEMVRRYPALAGIVHESNPSLI